MIDYKDFEDRIKNFLKVNKFLEAEQELQEGLDKFPNQLNLLVIATEVYRAVGDSKKSLSYSEILLIHYPGNPIGYISKIHNFLDLYQFQKAEDTAKKAITIFPDSLPIRVLLCSIYRRCGKGKKHIEQADYIIEKFPNKIQGYQQKLNALTNTRDNVEVMNVLHLANNHINNIVDLKSLWRTYYRKTGRREEALLTSQVIRKYKNGGSKNDFIEYSQDLLLLGQIDAFISAVKHFNLVEKCNLETLKRIIEPFAPRKLTDIEKNLITDLKIFPHYENLFFNPPAKKIIEISKEIPCIVLIHVGKCAGESLKNSLRRDFSLYSKVIEYHTFDSNFLIEDLLSQIMPADNVYFVICIRDPVMRWVSAYNYESHLYSIKKLFYAPSCVRYYFAKFTNLENLIDRLTDSDPEAITFANYHHLAFGHMAMGFSWYLPLTLIKRLPIKKTYLIQLDNIEQEYNNLRIKLLEDIGIISTNNSQISSKVLKINSNWIKSYEKKQFISYSELDDNNKQFLHEFLRPDFEVINLLKESFPVLCS